MHVFIRGATGWIGSAATAELLAAGHRVTGLARTDDAAATLTARSVAVLPGGLGDLDRLREGATAADAVVHLAYRHDWSDPAGSAALERAAVETLGETLAGSGRPFLLASGLAGIRADGPAAETDPSPAVGAVSPRGGAENLALGYVGRDVAVMPVRFAPSVHGPGDTAFIATLAGIARQRGMCAYIGDGGNRWAAVHRADAARLLACAVERPQPGTRLHAVAEEGISMRGIAQALGDALGLPVVSIAPEDAEAHFGWIARFLTAPMAATSDATRALLEWDPVGPTLLEDIAAGVYGRGAA